MEIEIRNCNNIKQGKIHIEESKINIFYGINGTGKSTISKAIELEVKSGNLETLKPFFSDEVPKIILPKSIKNILIFNDEYINNFTYQQDELLSNSFEIFIKTEKYKENEKKINELLVGIKKIFENNETLDKIINDFSILRPCFKRNQDDGLSKQSEFHKACGNGNLIENIPEGLGGYAPFIKSQDCTQRIDRQIKGNKFFGNYDVCPYCTSSIIEKKDEIQLVSKTYNKNDIEKLIKIRNAIEELGQYFSNDAKENIINITKQSNGLDLTQTYFLKKVSMEIEILYRQLNSLKNISFDDFSECDNIEDKLNKLKIDLNNITSFKSEYTQKIVDGFNDEIENLRKRIGELTGLINKQKIKLKELINKYTVGINSFLEKAGYNYEIDISSEQNYKLRLKPKGGKDCLNGGSQYLSFGEKNAFALILFMYEALSKLPDLIILDDPISSFDENKKYAIIHTLFAGNINNSLKGKNVIIFTHDIEPIIDMKKVRIKKFNDSVCTLFINNKGGILKINKIGKDDILSFYQIWERIKNSKEDDIVKLVYLRKLYNGLNDNGNEYQILSNLLHGRPKDECTDNRQSQSQQLSEEDFNIGINGIKEKRNTFDYDNLQNILSDKEKMLNIYHNTNSNLTKIIAFRRIYDLTNQENQNNQENIDEIVDKFIKEEYHIENSYLFGLDPIKFDTIPDFIIKICDKFINNLNN